MSLSREWSLDAELMFLLQIEDPAVLMEWLVGITGESMESRVPPGVEVVIVDMV